MNIKLNLQISKREKKSFKNKFPIKISKSILRNIKELRIKQRKLQKKFKKNKFKLIIFKERSNKKE